MIPRARDPEIGENLLTREKDYGIGRPLLIALLLGGPIAWALHQQVSYFMVGVACSTGWRTGLVPSLIAVTIVTAALDVLVAWVALRKWRALSRDEGAERSEGHRTRGFMLLGGFALAVLFLPVIVLEGIPAMMLRPCAPV